MRKKRMMKSQRQRQVHERDRFYIIPHSEGAFHGYTDVYKIRICTTILRGDGSSISVVQYRGVQRLIDLSCCVKLFTRSSEYRNSCRFAPTPSNANIQNSIHILYMPIRRPTWWRWAHIIIVVVG